MSEAEGTNSARRIAILDAAMDVFMRYGFKKTSMDDLARAAGISRQGLYLHFATKEALFKETVLRVVEATRAGGRAAMADDAHDLETRLLDSFVAVHGALIGLPGAEHWNELLATSVELVGPVVDELETAFVADVAKLLRTEGVVARWKDLGFTAKDLAEQLFSTSCGLKHRVKSQTAYRDSMKVAIRMLVRR